MKMEAWVHIKMTTTICDSDYLSRLSSRCSQTKTHFIDLGELGSGDYTTVPLERAETYQHQWDQGRVLSTPLRPPKERLCGALTGD